MHANRVPNIHISLKFNLYVRTLLSVLVGGFRRYDPPVPGTGHDVFVVIAQVIGEQNYPLLLPIDSGRGGEKI